MARAEYRRASAFIIEEVCAASSAVLASVKYFEETISKQTNAKNFHRHLNRFLIKIITRMKLSQNEEYENAFKELNEIFLPLIEEIS